MTLRKREGTETWKKKHQISNLWGNDCRRDQGPVLRQTAEEMKCIVTSTKIFWPSSFRHIDFQQKLTNNPHSLALEVSTMPLI
jgi:hypothetical protein